MPGDGAGPVSGEAGDGTVGTARAPDLPTALPDALARGDWPVALTLLERLEADDAADASLAYNRGLVLRRLGRERDAVAAFDRALALDPAHANALFERSCAQLDGDALGAAATGFARYLETEPGDAHARLNLGKALVRLGRPHEALEPLARAHAGLASGDSAIALALAHRDAGDLAACRAALDALPHGPGAAALRLKILVQGAKGAVPLRAAQLRATR